MTDYPNSRLITTSEAVLHLMALPLRFAGNAFMALCRMTPRALMFNALAETPDSELAARGLTRRQAAVRLLGHDL